VSPVESSTTKVIAFKLAVTMDVQRHRLLENLGIRQ